MTEIATWARVPGTGGCDVGEVRVLATLVNQFDQDLAEVGLGPHDRIRTLDLELVVDTGATMTVISAEGVDALGLRRRRERGVTYADGRPGVLWEAGGLVVRIMGREAEGSCIVGEPGSPALLGQISLESLDLLVDCAGRKLVVNPASPDRPHAKLY